MYQKFSSVGRKVLTLLVDTVQAFNVLVSLVLESGPVDLGVLLGNLESISVRLVKFLPTITQQVSSESRDSIATEKSHLTSAACHMTFLGTHPTLTQVPPSLQVSSMMATFAPYWAALLAAPSPPDPPPMTNRSK